MRNCLDAGTLRAYLDGELTEAQVCRADGHMAQCAECGARLEQMKGAVLRVDELLDALAPEDMAVIRKPRTSRRWTAGILAGAMAAAIAVILTAGKPARKPVIVTASRPLAATVPAVPPVRQSLPVKTARVRRRRRPQPRMGEFMALAGADPIQVGMVVRVMVPVSGRSLAADVVVGEDGRARAIRFIE
ncbi:MAG: hypothetical protein ABSH50_00410 [Bryobacteraceae bacterium]|jgi:hypothetical protein